MESSWARTSDTRPLMNSRHRQSNVAAAIPRNSDLRRGAFVGRQSGVCARLFRGPPEGGVGLFDVMESIPCHVLFSVISLLASTLVHSDRIREQRDRGPTRSPAPPPRRSGARAARFSSALTSALQWCATSILVRTMDYHARSDVNTNV